MLWKGNSMSLLMVQQNLHAYEGLQTWLVTVHW